MPGKTLDELEGDVWGAPTFDSYLVTTCHRLRTKPVDDFTVEDLRIMIGQKIGLEYLMPKALGVLEAEPLAEGDFFPGDLLGSVMGCSEWFTSHSDDLQRTLDLVQRAVNDYPDEGYGLRDQVQTFLDCHRT
ncbi:MAG: hypothetical protein JWN70_5480 [Planctomycetaceae bacterium]|nr:hypothetical protein [Planctomycetaceae bacterium]